MPLRHGASPEVCLTVLVLLLALSTNATARITADEELLPGWRGEEPRDQAKQVWVEHIAWSPRAFIFHNFLSDDEAQHLVNLSWPQMQRSTVVGPNGTSVLDDYRTSYGTFLMRYQDNVVRAVQDRIALFTHIPVINHEDMQILRYGIGQYYHQHTDSLEDTSPRVATLLLYLADAVEGGETAFPINSKWVHPEMERIYGSEFSECAKGHVGIKPRRGDGLLFWSAAPDGHTMDMASTHEGCAVIKGAKWTTTTWLHSKPFRPEEWNPRTQRFRPVAPFKDPGLCADAAPLLCPEWAHKGECTTNKQYMVGDALQVGNCMRSCEVCQTCEPGPAYEACYMTNRKRVGFLAFNQSELDYRRPAIQLSAATSR